MSRRLIGTLRANEEIVVENGRVYAEKEFDKLEWAEDILDEWETSCVDYYICTKAKTIVAFYQDYKIGIKPGISICHPNDKFGVRIGKAIALCRLKGLKIPKEIFE